MTTFLPPDVQAGLDAARKKSLLRNNRLRIEAGDEEYRILRAWENGFALESDDAPYLRGLVDMYDGARHICRCLIVASGEEHGEKYFEYKLMTEATGEQPLDFYRPPDAPVALLEKH